MEDKIDDHIHHFIYDCIYTCISQTYVSFCTSTSRIFFISSIRSLSNQNDCKTNKKHTCLDHYKHFSTIITPLAIFRPARVSQSRDSQACVCVWLSLWCMSENSLILISYSHLLQRETPLRSKCLRRTQIIRAFVPWYAHRALPLGARTKAAKVNYRRRPGVLLRLPG